MVILQARKPNRSADLRAAGLEVEVARLANGSFSKVGSL